MYGIASTKSRKLSGYSKQSKKFSSNPQMKISATFENLWQHRLQEFLLFSLQQPQNQIFSTQVPSLSYWRLKTGCIEVNTHYSIDGIYRRLYPADCPANSEASTCFILAVLCGQMNVFYLLHEFLIDWSCLILQKTTFVWFSVQKFSRIHQKFQLWIFHETFTSEVKVYLIK